MDLIENRNYYIYDFANKIRYILSYSKNENDFFENLIRAGILLVSDNDEFVFKTTFRTLSAKEIANFTEDDFFMTKNLKKNIGYNIRYNRKGNK